MDRTDRLTSKLKWVVMALAVSGMGISMPSCPGQQAMQQQIESLQSSQADTTRKLMAIDAKAKDLENKLGQLAQVVQGMNQQMTTKNDATTAEIEKMKKDVEELKARPVPQTPAAKKAAPKKKGK